MNFLGKIRILKEFEWFEWFEWFGPSPIEPFNPGLAGARAAPRGQPRGRARGDRAFVGRARQAPRIALARSSSAKMTISMIWLCEGEHFETKKAYQNKLAKIRFDTAEHDIL